MTRSTHHMKPSQLRLALSASMIALFAGGAVLFGLAYTQLQSFGKEVAAKNGEAKASDSSLDNLKTTKAFLERNTALISQTNAFVLERDLPQFQIRDDIVHYAQLYGLDTPQISTSTGAANGTGGAAATTPTSPAPTAATPTATPATPTAGAPAGGSQVGVSVSFEGDVDYMNFIKFLYALEHNLPKMTVDGVNLSTAKDGRVTVAPITVNTYTK